MNEEILNKIEDFGLPGFRFGALKGTDEPTLGAMLGRAIPVIFFVAGIALLIYLIFGGIALMTSGGDPKKIAGAKATLTNAAIGFTIIFLSYWIVQIIALVLGLSPILNIF